MPGLHHTISCWCPQCLRHHRNLVPHPCQYRRCLDCLLHPSPHHQCLETRPCLPRTRNYSIDRVSSRCTFLRKIRPCPTNRQSLSWPLRWRCHPHQDFRPCQGTLSHPHPPDLSSFRLRRPFAPVCRRLLEHPARRGLRLRPPCFHRCPRSESYQCHPGRQLPFHRGHPDYRPYSQARPTLPHHRSRTRLRISRSRRGQGTCWWPAQVGSKLSALVPFERSIDRAGEKSTREAEGRRLRSMRGDGSYTHPREMRA